MNMQPVNPFARFWSLGYHRLVPVIPPSAPISERSSLFKRLAKGDDARGKMPGVRWSDGTWSGFDFVAHESSEDDLARWWSMGAGVGIKTGRGLALIDADTLDARCAAIIQNTIETELGILPIRIGRAPKAGYLVRVEGGFTYCRVEFGERDAKGRLKDRVEVLYEGRQFVAEGLHPVTLTPYHWPGGVPALEDVPVVPAASLVALLRTLAGVLPAAKDVVLEGGGTEVDQALLRGDLDTVRRAVEAIPNNSSQFPSRESYVAMGYAIKAALPEDEPAAFELYADWCARWEDGENDPDIVAAEWRRMKGPFRRGASWLYETAEAASGGAFNAGEAMASRWFEPIGADEPLFPVENGSGAGGSAAARPKLVFTPIAEAADTALSVAARPLIKGLMDQGAMTVLYGASNTGKTFVAMDIAFHVAAGLPWGGMKTAEGFHVVYVAAEGGVGARKRAAALRRKYGDAADGRFHFLLMPVNLLRADADLQPLITAVSALGASVGLVVIDTLSRAMAGGDENTSTDMGAMVTHLDVLRKATGAHLMAVHHSGKDAMRGARGWSGLRAATDTEIEIADMQIAVTKQRDLDKAWSSAFVLDVVELGRDADGDPVTSCTVRLASKSEVSAGVVHGEATVKEGAVLEAVRELEGLGKDGSAGSTVSDIATFMEQQPEKMTKETVRFHLRSLLAKNLIRRSGRGHFVCVKIENDAADNLSNGVFGSLRFPPLWPSH